MKKRKKETPNNIVLDSKNVMEQFYSTSTPFIPKEVGHIDVVETNVELIEKETINLKRT